MKRIALVIAAVLALPVAANAAATPKPIAKPGVTVAQARTFTAKVFNEAVVSGAVITFKVGKCTAAKSGHAFCAYSLKGRDTSVTPAKVKNCTGRVEIRRNGKTLEWRIAPGAVCK